MVHILVSIIYSMFSALGGAQMVSSPAKNLSPMTRPDVAVSNRPLSAKFEQRLLEHSGRDSLAQVGIYYRNAEGSTRTEVELKDGGTTIAAFIVIELFSKGVGYVLTPDSKTAVQLDLGQLQEATRKPQWTFPGTNPIEMTIELIEGFQCRHFGFAVDQGARGEVWISDALGSVLRETIPVMDGLQIWRLFEIHEGEPMALLFQLPPEYRLVPPSR